ncbi:hypothetical protein Y032_0039g137 [Ancylostoma ceylanicum]|uniref:Leucine Rich repeat-containing domain protein n=2 Tax=Ancylostoma ceylanicum TaxID=53326 RepID=A0A016UIT4_9BILA|nr:hypothetical protein Y032_0039g137 [Ancylostoma ceylanicum]
MTAGEDVALSAPSLRDLSAGVLCQKTQLQDVVLKMHLPLPVSHSLFNKKKEEWQRSKEPVAAEALRAWCDSSRLPLSHLDLTGADLTDSLLADLLEAHQNGITQLDLTNIKGISDETNALLDQRNVAFPNLRSLKMTSMELLSRPPPRRKVGVASMDTRNVPVLGEEDLEGAGGLDQMRENRGGPSHSIHSSQQQQPVFEGCSTSFNGNSGISVSTEPVEAKVWEEEEEREPPVFTSRCPGVTTLALPKVKRFPEDEENSPNDLLRRVFEPLKDLRTLDLSYWNRMEDLRCIHPLHLTTLILFDVPDLYRTIDSIITMTELRFLDLSQSTRDTGLYPRPVTALHKIVTNLKELTCLDISSTNLAAQPSPKDWPVKPDMHQGNVRSDIVGLRFLSKPLDFIGLFNCENASHFGEIPAKHISGDANEDQVIMALQMYKDRAGLLQSVLNESYQLYRFGNSNPLVRHTEALHLVLNAMQNHLEDSTLQIAGSASLFYIIRKVAMNRDTKKRVVSALLSGMETHMEEQVMVRNCCLSLCQFEIPQEILFDYSRLAILLVTVLQHHNADNLTQRIVVFLLNSMACHVEGDQKVQVGSFGAIEMILDQIRRKLTTNVCDDVMEVGWSFLWNITDETPVNCERFLRADGLHLFHMCFDAFRNERELVRNMMGLIGNIAEVDGLRSQLMNDDYVKIFSALLDLVEDSIEISYNSAGVLAHMVSDGEEAWSCLTVRREQVMASVVKATEAWRLDTRRFINYRSFRPILRLLPLWHAYASQHWAVWALANLTTTDGAKYCAYVTDEGGIPLLEQLVIDERTTAPVRHLAKMVLNNIENWRTHSERERSSDDLMMESTEMMDTS